MLILGGVLLAASPAAGAEAPDPGAAGADAAEDDTGDEPDDFDDLNLEAEFALLEEESVVVSAARHRQDITNAPSSITVISRDQIENTHCTDLVCLLRQVPELDVLRIKPMYAAVGARAMTDQSSDKLLVLIDGLEVNNEVFGLVFWQMLPVHLDDIERIEIIRGPGSALYGANAHSGVVSIQTRRLTDHLSEVSLGGGEQQRVSLAARLGHRLGDWTVQAAGSLDRAGHWRLPGLLESDVARLRLRADVHLPSSEATIQASLVRARGQIYSILGPAWIDDALFANLLAAYRAEHIVAQISFNLQRAALPLDVDPQGDEVEIHLDKITLGTVDAVVPFTNTTLDVEGHYNDSFFAGNLLLVGGNYRWIGQFSDKLDPSEIYQHRVGLFVQDEQTLFEQLVLTAGVRLDYNSLTPFTISPRAAAVWEFVPAHSLRFTFGQAFRKPSLLNTSIHLKNARAAPGFPAFEDLMRRAIGNEDLDNERITSFEFGYRGAFWSGRLKSEAVVFYNRYRDTIALRIDIPTNAFGLPSLADGQITYRNQGREADSIGGSLSASLRVNRALFLQANYTYRRSTYTSNPTGFEDPEGGKGERVDWEPSHLANLGGHYLFDCGLRVGGAWHFASANRGYLSSGGAFDAREQYRNPARHFASLFASFRLDLSPGYLEVGVRAFNAFNTPFRDLVGQPRVKRNALGGELIGRQVFGFVRGAL